MPRIEDMKRRLENWARWREQGASGGLGYPRQSAFVRMAPVDGSADAVIPCDEIEAAKTDEAIQTLQFTKPHLHRTATLIYLKGLSIKYAAIELGRAQSTVKANLEQLDHALQQWYTDRAERLQAAAGRAQGSFTT